MPRAASTLDGFALAAMCFYVVTFLHLAAMVLSVSAPLWPLLAGAVVWAALATALLRRLRWMAWAAYAVALPGGLVALWQAVPLRTPEAAIYALIAALVWLGALCLAAHLWRYRGAIRRA